MTVCSGCDGRGWHETMVYHYDPALSGVRRYPCRTCKGTGDETVSYREFVGREAVSWCVDSRMVDVYQREGEYGTKAHRVNALHLPVCGAPVAHIVDHCSSAPVGWPQCKKCSKKPGLSVPAVFEAAI